MDGFLLAGPAALASLIGLMAANAGRSRLAVGSAAVVGVFAILYVTLVDRRLGALLPFVGAIAAILVLDWLGPRRRRSDGRT